MELISSVRIRLGSSTQHHDEKRAAIAVSEGTRKISLTCKKRSTSTKANQKKKTGEEKKREFYFNLFATRQWTSRFAISRPERESERWNMVARREALSLANGPDNRMCEKEMCSCSIKKGRRWRIQLVKGTKEKGKKHRPQEPDVDLMINVTPEGKKGGKRRPVWTPRRGTRRGKRQDAQISPHKVRDRNINNRASSEDGWG